MVAQKRMRFPNPFTSATASDKDAEMHETLLACRRLWNPPWASLWIRAWKGVIFGLLGGQGLAFLVNLLQHFPYQSVDFAQYYFLAQWVHQGGAFADPEWPFKVGILWPKWVYLVTPFLPYQPLLLPVMRVLRALPYTYAYLVWSGGAILLLWLLAGRLARNVTVSPLCIRVALLCFPSLWFGIYWGNVDLYLAAGVLGAVLLFYEGRVAWSGFLWGWLGAFKPFLLFGAAPALRRGGRSFLLGLIGGGMSAFLVAWRAVGGRGLWFLLERLPQYTQKTAQWFLDGNASITGWLSFWVGPETALSRPLLFHLPSVQPFALVLGLVLLAVTVWAWRKAPAPAPWLEEGLWLTLGMLMAPFAWPQYLLYLFGPLAVLYARFAQPAKPHRAWSAIAYLLLPALLTGFLWGGVDTHLLALIQFRVVSLFAGSIYFALWLLFLVSILEPRPA